MGAEPDEKQAIPMAVKPGVQTSEFAAMLCAAGISIAYIFGSFFAGRIVPLDDVVNLIGVITGIYTGARTVTKVAAIIKGH